ncbi:MAG: peptidoglycan DD-metalloendopeptidase family protein [Bdellovibrionaceae bacterium]|nr:peptidoglycan DD-metalloendopeptidase family protein [Pseudobdellovibrionaceae bacterium]
MSNKQNSFIFMVGVVLLFQNLCAAITKFSDEEDTSNSKFSKHNEDTLEDQQQKLIDALLRINIRQKKMVLKLDKLSKEKEVLEFNQAENIKEIKKLSETLIQTRKTLSQRVKTISKFKGENLFKTMLMFRNLSQIEKNLKIMSIITANDLIIIQEYFNDRTTLKEKLKISQSRLEELKKLEVAIEQNKIQSEKDYQSKVTFLEKIKKRKWIRDMANSKEVLLAKKVQDTGVFDFLNLKSIIAEKGKLPAPLRGIMTEKFGFFSEEELATIKNNGVFIDSSEDESIISIFDGKLIDAGEIKGLGKYAIIDHGDNYYSLYGNIKNLLISIGNAVKKGEKIAVTGSKYLDKQSGLYFELRHYSKVLNPQLWIGGWNESQRFN